MFCPKCRREFSEGIQKCTDCMENLVEKTPGISEDNDIKLVTVLYTVDHGLTAIAKSILDGAGIWYFAKGEAIQDLFGLGRIGYSVLTGPVEIQVRQEDEEVARALLEDLD